jgi:NADH-quinone oxidoreductase subunit M
VAILLGGAVTALGPYLLIRVGLGAMPEGARWAGASMAALGVLSVAYGGLCAMAQRDLRRFVAYASLGSSGACLFGLAAFTTQGIAGALAGLFAHGLAAAMLLGVAGALERRVQTSELAELGDMLAETPALAAVTVVGLAVSLGVPALAGFWGPLLALLGGFTRHPVLAAVMAMTFVASAAAHLRVGRMMLLGRPGAGRKGHHLLQPFGGLVPDATPRELAAFIPLAVLALVLGLWPVPLLSTMGAAVRDVSATVEPPSPDAGSP